MIFDIAIEKLSDATLVSLYCCVETATSDEGITQLFMVVSNELRNRGLLDPELGLTEEGLLLWVDTLQEQGLQSSFDPTEMTMKAAEGGE
jgi:hypothetical protein